MAKKNDIKSGLESVLNQEGEKILKRQPFAGRPGRPTRGDTRVRAHESSVYTSLYLNRENYEKLREIARINGLTNKDLLDAAIRKYIELYEEKYGPVEVARESRISADSLV